MFCSGPRTRQSDCPGSACLVLVLEQHKQISKSQEFVSLIPASSCFVLVPEQDKQISQSHTKMCDDSGICLSCSGPRTRQAYRPRSACLVPVPEQDKQISKSQQIFVVMPGSACLFWSQIAASRLPGISQKTIVLLPECCSAPRTRQADLKITKHIC